MVSCEEDDMGRLPSVEERIDEAVTNLRSELTTPANGWKMEYKPTEESGVFYIIMEFDEEGEVTIKSDVADNNGEFFDHTIPYRIDNALGLELILETYGVFHYLFEQDGATFGAEFEFIYRGKEGDNLVFESASDLSDIKTRITMVPAAETDNELFARQLSENLNYFATISPQALQPTNPRQRLIMENAGIALYWSLDPAKRIIHTFVAGSGTGFEDAGFNPSLVDRMTGYQLQGNRLIFLDPLEFIIQNRRYTINAIAFEEFTLSGPSLCETEGDASPEYRGRIQGLGQVTMTASLFDLAGTQFQPIAEFPYSVNSFFIFDETGTSLSEEGQIIAEMLPEASGFLFYYGFESDSIPANSVGFIIEDENGEASIITREFQETTTVGNRVEINFTGSFFHSGDPDETLEGKVTEITDLLFEGGKVYAFDFPVEDLTVFRLFNPCSRYEIFLVR